MKRNVTMAKEKCDEHSGCVNQIDTNKRNIETLFERITKVENRPPVWITLLFTAAVGVIGWLVKGS